MTLNWKIQMFLIFSHFVNNLYKIKKNNIFTVKIRKKIEKIHENKTVIYIINVGL